MKLNHREKVISVDRNFETEQRTLGMKAAEIAVSLNLTIWNNKQIENEIIVDKQQSDPNKHIQHRLDQTARKPTKNWKQ